MLSERCWLAVAGSKVLLRLRLLLLGGQHASKRGSFAALRHGKSLRLLLGKAMAQRLVEGKGVWILSHLQRGASLL